MTYAVVLFEHLQYLRLRNLRDTTINARRTAVIRYARAIPVDPLLATVEHVDRWQRDLCLSAAGKQHEMSHVTQFYRWLLMRALIPSDPSVVLMRPRTPRRLPRPMSEDALRQAIAAAPPRERAWLTLGAYEGLRVCEIARLNRDDVRDHEPPPILFVSDGKGGHQRILPLGAVALDALHRFGMPQRGPIFRRDDGRGAMSPNRMSQLVNRYLRGVGIPDTFHATRHRFCTQVYRVSGNLRLTQHLAGHASPATTSQYVAWSDPEAFGTVAALP